MSKIICEVCGTSFPETAEQCPICGCVTPGQSRSAAFDNDDALEMRSGYTYVKGGRFSQANVRKRMKTNPSYDYEEPEDDEEDDEEEYTSGSGNGLVVTAIFLLLCIMAVIVYITLRFFGFGMQADLPEQTTQTVSQTQIVCTSLTVVETDIPFSTPGSAWRIRPQKVPAQTTQEVSFSSLDESVAVVSADGVVTAVGAGETMIVITCGDQRVECRVVCDFNEATENTTEETTEGTYSQKDIIFNSRYNPPEATLRSEGETWNCYKGNIPVDEITWKSDDESVATVKDGIVTAVGAGKTEIHAIWGDFDVTCTIRCNFITTSTGIPGNDDVDLG